MRLFLGILAGFSFAVGSSVSFEARAEDCNSGHGCLISCAGGCAAVYIGHNSTCTKFCVGTILASNTPPLAPAISPQKALSETEVQEVLKQEATKKKLLGILCPPPTPSTPTQSP
jgi:hypothetical protein